MTSLSQPPKTGNDDFDRWLFLFFKSLNDVTETPTSETLYPIGYLKGDGSSRLASNAQIPYTDISGVPDATTTSSTQAVLGTLNRIDINSLFLPDILVDISAYYIGQTTITKLGTITTGTWTATSIGTAYTDAKVVSISGTANRITIAGTQTVPTVDIHTSYAGQSTIVTLGTVTTGTWNAGAVSSTGPITLTNGSNSRVVNNLLLKRDTTDATITELTTDGAAGSGATNRIAVPTNAAMSVVVNICAKVSGSANSKQMLRQFLITNTAGTTTIEGAVTVLGTDVGSVALATATTTITANNTDDCIKVEVTGVIATNIRWTAYIVSTETTYT